MPPLGEVGVLIHCVERTGVSRRCAWCHDALEDDTDTCEDCGTLLHAACVALAWGCPTLGCTQSVSRSRRRPRLALHLPGRGQRPLSTWGRSRRIVSALILPILCFTCAEAGLTGPLLPEWNDGTPGSWLQLFYHPATLRWFYPLIAWAMASFLLAERGRTGPWIGSGLVGGAVVSGLFALAFVPVIPMSVVGLTVFGAGILGLAPFFAFVSYLRASRRYLAQGTNSPGSEGDSPPRSKAAYVPRLLWGNLGVATVIGGVDTMNRLHAALSTTPPDCYIATAAARADPRLARPSPEAFDDGAVRPISRQLRTFKAAELVLRSLTPTLHRGLRAIYDRAGPPLAARMGTRSATLAYLSLLPLQLLADLGLRCLFRESDRLIDATYRQPT